MLNATQLQTKGIEPTDKRILIFSLIFNADEPLSVSQIITRITGKKIHRATVFRTVTLFEKVGLIQRVDLGEGEFRFELSSLPHHHFALCRTCGAVERINECTASGIKKNQKKKTGFTTVDHSLTFFGICKKCTDLV